MIKEEKKHSSKEEVADMEISFHKCLVEAWEVVAHKDQKKEKMYNIQLK